jgi:hypothetical protein
MGLLARVLRPSEPTHDRPPCSFLPSLGGMVPMAPNLVIVHSCLGGFLLVDVLSNVHSCLGGSYSPFRFIHFFCYTTIHNKLDRQSFLLMC